MAHQKKRPKGLLPIFGRRLLVVLLILLQIALLIYMLFRSYHTYWIAAALTVLSVLTAFHLLTRHDIAEFKLSLVFLILLFPVFGGAFYWVFHFQTRSSGFRRRLDRLTQHSRKGYPVSNASLLHAASAHPQDARLLHYLQKTAAFPAYTNTESRYFPSGRDILTSLLHDLKAAKRYIFLEYFIIAEGVMWDAIRDVLTEKVAQGVDVRVIYDDIGSIRTLPAGYAKKLNKLGIRCKVFNPFHPFLTSTQNNRNHRKIAVIDGKIAYTGGINLADEYIGEKIRFGKWKDNAIRLHGAAAASFTIMFLQMWSLLSETEEQQSAYLPAPQFDVKDGWVQPYNDSPMDREHVSEHVYLHAITRAKRYLYITTPYLMPGSELMSALKVAAKSGVDVRIITPEIPDKRAVHATTRSYYRELLSVGVRIYEYSDGFMHAKTVISDGEFATIGTVNMDFRSLYLHFECGTVLYGASSIAAIEADFSDALTQSREVTLADCRHNLFVRLFQDICRIFAPLM